MRIIDNETVRAVLDMPTCIDAMEAAFREQATGEAISHPRQRFKVGGRDGSRDYMANMLAGAVPSAGVASLRFDSMLVEDHVVGGMRRLECFYPQRRSWGFVLLFSLESGEPLACIQDFDLSPLRVGATTGVAVRLLANPDASVVALFGSGNQARRNLEAICAVRPVSKVFVYSPNQGHREQFASEMSRSLDVAIEPIAAPNAAVADADIVMCATNSSEPVFDGTLLHGGQLVINLGGGTGPYHNRQEVDDLTLVRSDRIIINHMATVIGNNQREILDLIESGRVPRSRFVELGELVLDPTKGRTSPDQLVYYRSNSGVAIQFAAAGAIILSECEKRNLGHVIPTEWFGSDIGSWLDAGFNPAP